MEELTVVPNKIRIESSSHCQLKCPSCPTATGEIRKAIKGEHLSYMNFVRLVRENPTITDVELSNYGEMFLNPALYDIIKYSYGKVRLHADNGVNFNYVSKGVLHSLVRYEFKSMTVSIDGVTPESYAKYRVGGSFNQVISNIQNLNALKKLYGIDFPKLTWQMVVFGHNESEIERARAMAEELNMKFFAKLSWDEDYSPIQNKDLVQIQTGSHYTNRKEYEKETGENYCRGICQQLWNAPVINSDGTMLGCCRNYWGDFGPNIFDVGLRKSLRSEKMQYAKNMLTGNVESREDIPCTTCDIYHSLVRSRKFLTAQEIHDENKTLAEKMA